MRRQSMMCRYGMVLVAVLGLILLGPVVPAYADNPFLDPADQLPQGGGSTGSAPVAAAAVASEQPPRDLGAPQALPLPAPLLRPAMQQGPSGPNDIQTWAQMLFNPGKWAMDTVLGSLAATLYSITALFSALGLWAFGGPDTASGYIAANGIVFTTPTRYTVGQGSTGNAYGIVQQVAIAFLVLVATYRLLRLFAEDDKATAALRLAWQLGSAVCLILGAQRLCVFMIDASNAISALILHDFTFADGLAGAITPGVPTVDQSPALSIVLALANLLYYLTLAWLALLSIGRLVLANLLIVVSPLVGLAVGTSSWTYGRVWFARFLEVLVTPILWGITLGLMRQFIGSFALGDDSVVTLVLGAYMLFLVPKVTHAVGLAAAGAAQQMQLMPWIIAARSTVGRMTH